jgi:predicted kinase
MATLFLICGLPGAGKTTLAKRLEQEQQALRLCPDEWIAPVLKDTSDQVELDRLRSPVETLQWDVAKQVLSLGVNVILENGFWGREEREQYRSRAETLGAKVELHFLEVSLDELWQRLSKRNADLPSGAFVVTKEQLESWWNLFEPPAKEELECYK